MIVVNVETLRDGRGWFVKIERVDGLKRTQIYTCTAVKHAHAEGPLDAAHFGVRSALAYGGDTFDSPEDCDR